MNYKNITLFFAVATCFATVTLPFITQQSRPSLDEIALKHGADKSSAWHGYTFFYEKNFTQLRDTPINFLEIGTCQGLSARMWEEYFSHKNAKFFTIDIEPLCANYLKGLSRTTFCCLSQSDRQALLMLAKSAGQFDVIIDDGSHVSADQIISFKTLFDYIKPGGIYVIEDLLFSYHPEHITYSDIEEVKNPHPCDNSTIYFLHSLINDLNYVGARTGCAHIHKTKVTTGWTKLNLDFEKIDNELTSYQRDIDHIEFAGSICFIFKKSK
jgi:hypothetical protein